LRRRARHGARGARGGARSAISGVALEDPTQIPQMPRLPTERVLKQALMGCHDVSRFPFGWIVFFFCWFPKEKLGG